MGVCERVGRALDYLAQAGVNEDTLTQIAEMFRENPGIEKLFFKELLESNLIGGTKHDIVRDQRAVSRMGY